MQVCSRSQAHIEQQVPKDSVQNSYRYPRIITFLLLKLSEQRALSYLPHIFEKLVFLSLHTYLYSKINVLTSEKCCKFIRSNE